MPSKIALSYVDYDKEITTMQYNIRDVTGGNIVTIQNEIQDLKDAIGEITRGNLAQTQISLIERQAVSYPNDASVQRERKWLVVAVDTTENFEQGAELIPNRNFGLKFTFEIGTALLDTNLLRNDGHWTYNPLTNLPADWANFKTAFQNLVLSPSGGTLRILDVLHVGRNT